MNAYRKALLASAFFVSAVLVGGLLPAPSLAAADCRAPGTLQHATLGRVLDGDTLELEDGRRVRLIGINTPELGQARHPDQPLAQQARQSAQQFLQAGRLGLAIGAAAHDRHGRLLAHVFDPEGRSLEAHLLALGLGFPLSIPPNLALRDCLNRHAAEAQRRGLGVWSNTYFAPRPVGSLQPSDGGFGRYRGRVSAVGENRAGLYLELEQRLYLPIDKADRDHFDPAQLQRLAGQQVEVSGWLSYRELSAAQRARHWRPFRLRLQHPDQLIRLGTQ